jgi:hypothetical protein
MSRVPFDPAIDYYKLLGVSPGAFSEEIQAAYRRLAKEFHPDLHAGSADGAARMAGLNAAKSVLLDRDARAGYDQARAARRPVRPSPARAGSATPSVRYSPAPFQVSAQPRYRVVPRAAVRSAPSGAFDRQTGILLIVAVPLVAALLLYVFQALQLSAQPLRAASTDVSLAPTGRPPAPQGAASIVFEMVHAQPPSRELAIKANNMILSRTDSSPESALLRAAGRRLLRSAGADDVADWNATITDLCVMAGQC